MVIEVKTRLDRNQLAAAIENIRAAKQLRQLIMGMVFAFGSSQIETIIENLRQYSEDFPMQYAPEVILLLERKTVFIGTPRMGDKSTYLVRTAKDEGVLVTYLLLRFLNELSLSTGIPRGALFAAAGQVLVNETEVVSQDVRIGGYKPQSVHHRSRPR
jgi:hypothetical protein